MKPYPKPYVLFPPGCRLSVWDWLATAVIGLILFAAGLALAVFVYLPVVLAGIPALFKRSSVRRPSIPSRWVYFQSAAVLLAPVVPVVAESWKASNCEPNIVIIHHSDNNQPGYRAFIIGKSGTVPVKNCTYSDLWFRGQYVTGGATNQFTIFFFTQGNQPVRLA